jgi:hypothetical protein
MFEKAFGTKISIASILICVGIFISFGFASAGTFSANGKAFDSDGTSPLPGTGLSDLVTADPEQAYGYVQCIFAGADGEIDPPDTDGSITDDDVLLETAEYPGQFFTAVGEGYPFLPNGRFFEDFTHALDVGSMIYCRVWNGTSPSTSTYYGDSELYSLADKEFDDNDFGSWSTDTKISVENLPPVLDPIGAKSVDEGEQLEFIITATDPDGDALTYSASNVPAGASFDPVTQTFTWTPAFGEAGNYAVTFTVTDDGTPPLSDSEEVTITVNAGCVEVSVPSVVGMTEAEALAAITDAGLVMEVTYEVTGDPKGYVVSQLPLADERYARDLSCL